MAQETAVDFLFDRFNMLFVFQEGIPEELQNAFDQAKELEKEQIDNKVIHFAEWLTQKHTLTLMALYEQFEELHYNKEL